MSSTDISKPLRTLNPGTLDAWWGPYANLTAACAAIPNETKDVDGVLVNFRQGKIIAIVTSEGVKEYWWKNGYLDNDLIEYFEVTKSTVYIPLGANLVSNKATGKLWGTSSPATQTTNSQYGAIGLIDCTSGDSLTLEGITQSMQNGNLGRFFDASGNYLSTIIPSSFSAIDGGYKLVIPSNPAGISKIGLHFSLADLSTVVVRKGNYILRKFRLDQLPDPVTKTSQLTNDSGFIESNVAVAKSDLYDTVPNLILTLNTGLYTNASSVPNSTAGYTRSQLIDVNPGDVLVIKNLVASLTNNSIAKCYNSSGVYVAEILTSSLYAINGYHRMTVPINAGIVKAGFHFKNPDGPVQNTGLITSLLLQRGVYLNLGSIKDEKLSGKNISIFNNDLGYVTAGAIANTLAAPSNIEANWFFEKGKALKLYLAKLYCILIAGQSHLDGRTEWSELPQSFKDACTLNPDGSYSLPGTNYWRTTSGPFVNFSVANGAQWPWDLFLYQSLRDYLRTKNNDPNYSIYAIKDALGGTSISVEGETAPIGVWFPDFDKIPETKEALLKRFEKRIRTAMTVNGVLCDIRVFIWDQGEGDRGTLVAPFYYQNLKNLISYVRGIVDNPRLPVILVGCNTSNLQYSPVVDAAKRRLASEDSFIKYVEVANGAAYLKPIDNIHLNALGAKDRADKVFELIKDLVPQTNTKGGPLS